MSKDDFQNVGKRSKRMTTGIERVFRAAAPGGVLYREWLLHWIHFLDDSGNIISSKLDKSIQGQLYRRPAGPQEHSSHGEIWYTFPEDSEPTRLIAAGFDWSDTRYGRF